MTFEEFENQLNMIRRELPEIYQTFSEPEFIESWFRDYFRHYRRESVVEALKQVRKRDILPKCGRFMNDWNQIAARLNGEAKAKDANTRLLEMNALSEDHCKQPMYRCPICRDTGHVSIWSQRTMSELLRQQPLDDVSWNSMDAACECEKGDHVIADWKGKRPLGQFGTKDYFLQSHVENAKQKAIEFVELFRTGMHRADKSLQAWNSAEEF